MILKSEMRSVFPFEYNEKNFSCIFLTDITPFRLYLTTLGKNPQVFELEVKKGYKVDRYWDDYKKLLSYLQLKYDPNHIFRPSDFFEALNRKIPQRHIGKPDYKDVILTASSKRNIEEINKIYFCGWLINATGRSVSPENLEKTRSAFGEEKAQICKNKNISSRWTDIKHKEDLNKLVDIGKM